MLSGKLGTIQKQRDSRRRFTVACSDAICHRHQIADGIFNREMQSARIRMERHSLEMRRSAIKMKVFQECMERRRMESKAYDHSDMFGIYNGMPVQTFYYDMEEYLQFKTNPQNKRKEISNSLLDNSRKTGFILDSEQVENKIQSYFMNNWGVDFKTNNSKKLLSQKYQERLKENKNDRSKTCLELPTISHNRNRTKIKTDVDKVQDRVTSSQNSFRLLQSTNRTNTFAFR